MLQDLRNTDQKGFTLIELMIVIAIIGILAAIAIPNFINYRNQGHCKHLESAAASVAADFANWTANPANVDPADYNAEAPNVQVNADYVNPPAFDGATGTITITGSDANNCPLGTTYTQIIGGTGGSYGAAAGG